MTTSLPIEEPTIVELDLTGLLASRHAQRFDQAHIVDWLRASGGTLTERVMKAAAADLIEGQRVEAS